MLQLQAILLLLLWLLLVLLMLLYPLLMLLPVCNSYVAAVAAAVVAVAAVACGCTAAIVVAPFFSNLFFYIFVTVLCNAHTCKKIHTKCFVSEDRMCSAERSVVGRWGNLELGIKGAETGLPALLWPCVTAQHSVLSFFGVKLKPLETITIAAATAAPRSPAIVESIDPQ